MANWRSLANTLDAAIDSQYGEAIELQPYYVAQYMTEPVPDGTRQIVSGIGYVVGRGTFLKAAGNAAFVAKRADADLLLRVQDKYLTDIRQGDRVVLKDAERNGLTFEISYIEEGMYGRSILHLLKAKS